MSTESTVSVTELARNLADFINRVVYKRERFRLTRGNRIVADLNPAPTGVSLSDLPGLLDNLPHLSPDELDSFSSDIDKAQKSVPELKPSTQWES